MFRWDRYRREECKIRCHCRALGRLLKCRWSRPTTHLSVMGSKSEPAFVARLFVLLRSAWLFWQGLTGPAMLGGSVNVGFSLGKKTGAARVRVHGLCLESSVAHSVLRNTCGTPNPLPPVATTPSSVFCLTVTLMCLTHLNILGDLCRPQWRDAEGYLKLTDSKFPIFKWTNFFSVLYSATCKR